MTDPRYINSADRAIGMLEMIRTELKRDDDLRNCILGIDEVIDFLNGSSVLDYTSEEDEAFEALAASTGCQVYDDGNWSDLKLAFDDQFGAKVVRK